MSLLCSATFSSTKLDLDRFLSLLEAVTFKDFTRNNMFSKQNLFPRALRSWTSAGGDVDGQLVVMVLQLHDRHDLPDTPTDDGRVSVHHLLHGLLSVDGFAEVLHAGDARQGHFRDRSASLEWLPFASSRKQFASHRCLLNVSKFFVDRMFFSYFLRIIECSVTKWRLCDG